jgi:hypothetical protein
MGGTVRHACRRVRDYGLATGGRMIHEIGTTRMGNNPSTSVLNKNSQAHDVKNLFVGRRRAVRQPGRQEPDVDDSSRCRCARASSSSQSARRGASDVGHESTTGAAGARAAPRRGARVSWTGADVPPQPRRRQALQPRADEYALHAEVLHAARVRDGRRPRRT